MILATIHVPPEYVGAVLALCQDRRGIQKDMTPARHARAGALRAAAHRGRASDFHDRLKSATRGYGSFDYELIGYRPRDLVKLDVLVNGDPVDALSLIVHRDKAYHARHRAGAQAQGVHPAPDVRRGDPGRDRLARSIARTNVKALRKNVTAKCYGGDITRKRKLLEKQKEGKKRMKRVGLGRDPAGGLPRGAAAGRRVSARDRRQRSAPQPSAGREAAAPAARRSGTSSGRSRWRSLIALAIRAFVIEPFRIPSGSMLPTLLIGDHLFVNKFVYGVKHPVHGPAAAGLREPAARRRGGLRRRARRRAASIPADQRPDLPTRAAS